MERKPVQSKAILSMGYDQIEQVLEIEFGTGRIYQYLDVPEELYAWILRAPGKGALFNRLVEGKFRFRRLGADTDDAVDLGEALRASLETATGKAAADEVGQAVEPRDVAAAAMQTPPSEDEGGDTADVLDLAAALRASLQAKAGDDEADDPKR
ncbi:MAG: KTSC domain-containing protein [Deltaproteobacteria bacterium]|nr:KTSC domain-containing protein [Deltaproteobacteria bacterium]